MLNAHHNFDDYIVRLNEMTANKMFKFLKSKFHDFSEII